MTHATKVFLFDGLRDADLFGRILGGDLAQVNLALAAILDSRLIAAIDGGLPMMVPSKAAQIDGVVVSSMSEDQAVRLAFYYAALGCLPGTQVIMHAMRLITVQAYTRPYCADLAGADWQLQSAVELHVSVARDVMAQYSHLSVEQLALSRPRIYARAHSAQRAEAAPSRNVGSQMPVQAVRTFGTRAP